MKLEWIDDLLAIADAGSLSGAARLRYLSQPAFSRRIRAIEQSIGSELIDRSHKPVSLKKTVLELEPTLREASRSIHALQQTLSRSSDTQRELVIVSQHAISTAIAPQLIKQLTLEQNVRIRLRSANREECHGLLFSRQADIGLLYQIEDEQTAASTDFINTIELGNEPLVPVISAEHADAFHQELANGQLRLVAYPQAVFLGSVLSRHLLPQLDNQVHIHWVTETALTTAAMQFALEGMGLAWVPLSLAKTAIERQELTRLDPLFPKVSMRVVAMKLAEPGNKLLQSLWSALVRNA